MNRPKAKRGEQKLHGIVVSILEVLESLRVAEAVK
jgi:hypothetical protein